MVCQMVRRRWARRVPVQRAVSRRNRSVAASNSWQRARNICTEAGTGPDAGSAGGLPAEGPAPDTGAGTAALVWLVLRVYRNRRFELADAFVLVGFLTEFLPWVLVSRTMFIYHYFASVPFFIIAIVMYIRDWEKKELPRDANPYLQVIIALVAAAVVSVFMSLMLTALLVAVQLFPA